MNPNLKQKTGQSLESTHLHHKYEFMNNAVFLEFIKDRWDEAEEILVRSIGIKNVTFLFDNRIP